MPAEDSELMEYLTKVMSLVGLPNVLQVGSVGQTEVCDQAEMAQVVPGSEIGKAKDSLSTSTPHPIRQTPEPEEKEASQEEEEEEGSGLCKPKGQEKAAAAALSPSPIIRAPRGIFGEGDAAAALPGHSGRNPRVGKGRGKRHTAPAAPTCKPKTRELYGGCGHLIQVCRTPHLICVNCTY